MIIPIRTESRIRRTPYVNLLLIGINMSFFLLLDENLFGDTVNSLKDRYLAFESSGPAFYQFFTYQFLHADVWHLFGNLLFLWVFGNSVNGKMGDGPYLLFYLAGGVFAAWGWAVTNPGPGHLVGASGAIAAITTAYLALFPRSRVTVMVWFLLIYFFELSAMIIIGLKIVVWDNILAPSFGPPDNVANQAHLAGYLFGFVGALAMLFVRAIPRDQFDILALWRRWHLRREFAAGMSRQAGAAEARFGSVARTDPVSPARRAIEEQQLDKIAELRSRISEAVVRRDLENATANHEELISIDPGQCLSEIQQLDIAREYYRTNRSAQAAAAFERFAASYPHSRETANIQLLLGIIYARDLRQYEVADKHLTRSLEALHDEGRRAQCLQWLRDVRAALGGSAPEEL